ncbi:FAD-dependent oxidoreductase [Thalassomonas sp. RHCl1]|uniref:NAD(P)/FAD-dependent oxidoreductase n=1 Tax=Thalassomonas sp. RHCl1 TaxID=2995320 RepID=UPI00248B81B6|nr:FAD-dependent oxidoreductase [Thalassomonas sp. RHCl1]
MKTEVLIIGGGFAGASVAQTLEKSGVKTTLIDKKDYFEVTFATLRNITDPQKTQNRARKKYRDFLTGQFIQSSVVELTPDTATLVDGTEIQFQRAIIASGTRYPGMSVAKPDTAMDIDSRNNELLDVYEQLKMAKKVLVIGGGIVGVELAGEIAYAMPNIELTLAHNSNTLLNGFKEKTQRKSLEQLQNLGVKVMFNARYTKVGDSYIDENTGVASDANLVFQATGTLPNNEFIKPRLAHILNDHGYVKVNEKLEVIGQETLYALGDIADVGEAKLGYLAHEQGNYLAKVIVNTLKGKSYKGYKRNPLMALIPTGQKSGVFQLPFAVTTLNFLIGIKQKDLFISKIYKGLGSEPNPH